MQKFFETLIAQGWALYVPERIFKAHQDGLLRGWSCARSLGPEDAYTGDLLEFFDEQQIDLRLPLDCRGGNPWGGEYQWWSRMDSPNRFIPWTKDTDCPPLPSSTIASDAIWDALDSKFALSGSLTNRLLAYAGSVYLVRFIRIWTATSVGYWGKEQYAHPEEREDPNLQYQLRKRLRQEYGLTGNYFGRFGQRRSVLALLKKTYPLEQVRRLRRQLEDRLRKDPAAVVRSAVAGGLLKD